MRLDPDLVRRVEERIHPRSIADLVEEQLRRVLGGAAEQQHDARRRFFEKVALFVEKEWGSCRASEIPPDAIHRVALAVLADRDWLADHSAAIARDDADEAKRARQQLHQELGKTVRRLLGAEVTGRSLPLDPSTNLVESFSFLGPEKIPPFTGRTVLAVASGNTDEHAALREAGRTIRTSEYGPKFSAEQRGDMRRIGAALEAGTFHHVGKLGVDPKVRIWVPKGTIRGSQPKVLEFEDVTLDVTDDYVDPVS